MAAGLGFKDFVTGEVLTAADVDGYLMQGTWVFADAAARTAAVTSPQEGNMSYLKDTNSTEYYSGSAWVAIGGASGALTLVATSSPSASATVSINNCFTSTYTNYMIIANLTASENSGLSLRLRASSSDNSSSNYVFNDAYQFIGAATAAFSTGSSGQPGTANYFGLGYVDTGGENIQNINIYSPQATQKTTYNSVCLGAYPATNYLLSYRSAGIMTVTTSYDGFTIYPNSGTLTGKVRVYGIGQ